jgi:hypothetical protein
VNAGARPIHPDAARIASELRAHFQSNLICVLFFGSRYLGTSPDGTSACDLFLVVHDYLKFYRLRFPGIRWSHGPRFLALLNRILPPNIVSLSGENAGAGAKCFVMSWEDFDRATRRKSPDHFVKGRLTQDIAVVDAVGEEARWRVEACLHRARESSIDWVPIFLQGGGTRPFGVEDYCIRMLQVSYAHEIRPEPEARVREVFAAQRAFFGEIYGEILERAVEQGILARDGGRYRVLSAPGWTIRLGWRAYFRASKLRATLRWLKYTMTFQDWLDYLIRKVERRTGLSVDVTPLERRFPFLLLWPKVFRVLRERDAGKGRRSRTADRGAG